MTSAVNVGQSLFVDDDGTIFPITNWFDEEGDECASEEAVSAVAGEGGCWFAIDLTQFVSAQVQ